MIARLLRTPLTWLVLAVLAVGTAAGLYWFQPWKLVTDREVDEALSDPVGVTPGAPTGPDAPSAPPTGTPAPTAGRATLVRLGTFVTHEHRTTGTARLVRTADGRYRLELVDLDTSNGPDLRVWLTDQRVTGGSSGWRVFDDGRWVELGRLKGNRGDQAYDLPAGADPAAFTSVAIWCKRFSVSFGAAPLAPPAVNP